MSFLLLNKQSFLILNKLKYTQLFKKPNFQWFLDNCQLLHTVLSDSC